MTITFALMRAFVAAFLVGVGVGVLFQIINRLIRGMTNAQD